MIIGLKVVAIGSTSAIKRPSGRVRRCYSPSDEVKRVIKPQRMLVKHVASLMAEASSSGWSYLPA